MSKTNGKLTRAAIDSITFPFERVEVPEWNGAVYVRMMGARERTTFIERWAGSQMDAARMICDLLARVLCADPEGTRLYGDDEADKLGDKLGPSVDTLGTIALMHNRLGGTTKKK